MRSNSLRLIVLVAALSAGLYWLVRSRPAATPTGETLLLDDTPSIVEGSSTTVLDTPTAFDVRVADDSRDGAGTTAPATRPESMPDFATKYAAKSRIELHACLGEVRVLRLDLQRRIVSEREAAGQFVRFTPEPGKPFDASKIAMAEVDQKYRQPGQHVTVHVRGGGGKGYVEISGIPPGEYPEFDRLQAEEMWLHGRIAEVEGH